MIKNHGNENVESARGQIAIRESDFRKIPEIVRDPDYAIVGAKRNGKCIMIYSKKVNGDTDKDAVLNIATSRYKTDVWHRASPSPHISLSW